MPTAPPAWMLTMLMAGGLLCLPAFLLLASVRRAGAALGLAGLALLGLAGTVSLCLPVEALTGPGKLPLMLLASAALLCLVESLRRELRAEPAPWQAYGAVLLVQGLLHLALDAAAQSPSWARTLQWLPSVALCLGLLWLLHRLWLRFGGLALPLMGLAPVAWLLSLLVQLTTWHGVAPSGPGEPLASLSLANLPLWTGLLGTAWYAQAYLGFVGEQDRTAHAAALAQVKRAREGKRLAEQALAERHELMAQVASMGQLAQAGALAASLTHQLSQPLTTLLLNVQQAQVFAQNPAAAKHMPLLLQEAERATLKAGEMLRQVKNMFGASPGLQAAHPDELVRLAADMMTRQLQDNGIGLDTDLQCAPSARLPTKGLEHAVLNLLQHSLSRLRGAHSGSLLQIHTWTQGGQFVLSFEVLWHDEGSTVGPEIFEMPLGENLPPAPVGLWLARFIVERQQGRIALEPSPAGSLRIVLFLPLAATEHSERAGILHSQD